MNWKEEISHYYESRKPAKIWNTKEDVESYIEAVVIPAFESIKTQLMPYAKNIKVKRYIYKANISFEENEIRKSVFHVAISAKYNSINFPYSLNGLWCSGPHISIDEKENLDQDFIIGEFMKFFLSREEKIEEGREYESAESEDA